MAAKPSAYWQDHAGLLHDLLPRHRTGSTTDWYAIQRQMPDPKPSVDALRFKAKRLDLMGPPPTVTTGSASSNEWRGLEPILLPPPPPPSCDKRATETTIVGSDFHFGPDTHDAGCEEIFLDVIADLRPQTVVLNGDLSDMLAISKYPKDVRLKQDLGAERRQFHAFLHRLHTIVGEWGGRIVETNGNHSGEGREGRWWRYLSDRIPEVAGDPEFMEALSYRRMWHPEWSRVEIADVHVVTPGLIVLHGDVVRAHSAYSARGMLEKWRHSLIHGHTHRSGRYGYSVPPVAGKKPHFMRAFEGSCLCRLDPPYGSGVAVNWSQGFTIVRHDDYGNFGVEQVDIINGEAVVCALGATYRASD